MCVETLTGVLFWSFDLLGNFRAACFPFETSSGSLLAFCEFSFGADIIITDPPGAFLAARLPAETAENEPRFAPQK